MRSDVISFVPKAALNKDGYCGCAANFLTILANVSSISIFEVIGFTGKLSNCKTPPSHIKELFQAIFMSGGALNCVSPSSTPWLFACPTCANAEFCKWQVPHAISPVRDKIPS